MSNYKAIHDIEDTLKKLLEKDGIWEGIDPKPAITFDSPIKLDDSKNQLSVFLYQIVENVHLKNEGFQGIGNTQLKPPSIALDLFYLVTPFGDKKLLILGRIMQVLFDHALLSDTDLTEGLKNSDEEIKILLNPISLDDMTKIWSAFKEAPYRLSVSYLISPVRIDSAISIDTHRVVSKETGIYQSLPNC